MKEFLLSLNYPNPSTMLRLVTISCLVASTTAQWNPYFEYEDMFYKSESDSLSNLKCSNIDGSLKGCFECYECNQDIIQKKREKGIDIYNLTLTNEDCNSTQICCLAQGSMSFRDLNSLCGISNPNGYPYSRRSRLRAVLQGEYPWRAWVYRKADSSSPLCAATYINNVAHSLLAPGGCVRDENANSLVVRFSKDDRENYFVNKITVHNNFNPDTHENDIALLKLNSVSFVPSWVKPACLPMDSLPFGSSCVGVSDNDNSINFVTPNQSECHKTDPQFSNSHMCAISPPRDYKHEYGGGLFFLNDDEKTPTYTIYGIALHRSGDTVSMYTNVTNFLKWIEDNTRFI